MSDKHLEWETRMDQWCESGLSMAAWCRKENINIHQMYYWKRKFDQQTDNTSSTDWCKSAHYFGTLFSNYFQRDSEIMC
ncbi:hypothetical protein ACFO3D_03710 [Virgibacillus kekensis]|uniref:Transposase n=1 Tax=Virgibacillus kekensis TaxID=202261 RepID=A0ABV9DG35_9BACI